MKTEKATELTHLVHSPNTGVGGEENPRTLEALKEFGIDKEKYFNIASDSFTCTGNKFDDFKEFTMHAWSTLPKSVIGTLIYFLTIELNAKHFHFFSFLKCLVMVGFPVYVTYIFQGTILYNLWLTMPSMSANDDDGNLCGLPIPLEIAALTVFFIAIGPSFIDSWNESSIVLGCVSAAYKGEADEGVVSIHKLHWNPVKRAFTWLLVCAAEALILLGMVYVGTLFILTSNGVGAIVLNSVGICFVMDIDNMAREAFQSELVSEHIDQWEFDTNQTIKLLEKASKGGKKEASDIPWELLGEFQSLEKSIGALAIGAAVVYILHSQFC